MKNFVSVSTNAARIQDISLNPQKLAGMCAKLKCCLNYEVDDYVEASRKMPARDIVLQTLDSDYYLFKSDILAGTVVYSTDKGIAANLEEITAERARTIIEMNKRGEKPESLTEDGTVKQDTRPRDLLADADISRFDKARKRKKKPAKRQGGAPGSTAPRKGEGQRRNNQQRRNNRPEGEPTQGVHLSQVHQPSSSTNNSVGAAETAEPPKVHQPKNSTNSSVGAAETAAPPKVHQPSRENTPTITNKTNETYNMAKFKRILLKLSGESLMGKQSFGIDPVRLGEYAEQIKEVHEMGVQIGIVIGGGNIFRGLSGASKGFDRVKGDQMGMCATVINSLALSSALGALGVKTKVLTAIRMEPIGEFYSKWKAIEAMEAGYVCIFSAGTGSPYFTTDTGSSLRGIEIEADVMLKGTRVDGIYTADPEKDPTATKFTDITYDEIYTRGLKVMDLTATTMCKENNLPIYVFNMDIVGNLKKVMQGEEHGKTYDLTEMAGTMEATVKNLDTGKWTRCILARRKARLRCWC
jgi:uridylate kinase